ncbi:MAG: DnaA regulatory inactivator Hda, partial [Pseudomonadota bacterium]|nr:DnaA regulatory inactivator Hda [Pseudomonadota bacterium]
QLQSADDGFKKQILQYRANLRGISLSDQVCDYILQRSERSLAGLIAVLERLDSESLQRQRRLTVPLVKDVMGW